MVELLNAKGTVIEARRFAAPDVTISGPRILSLDFTFKTGEVATIKGLSMKCKKLTFGVLPGSDEDAALEHERIALALERSFETERRSYGEWFTRHDVDYEQDHAYSSGEVFCKAGDIHEQGDKCSKAAQEAERIVKARQKEFGEPILPSGRPTTYP